MSYFVRKLEFESRATTSVIHVHAESDDGRGTIDFIVSVTDPRAKELRINMIFDIEVGW